MTFKEFVELKENGLFTTAGWAGPARKNPPHNVDPYLSEPGGGGMPSVPAAAPPPPQKKMKKMKKK